MDEKCADFCDVNGQKFIKRACEVAAGGMHNILLVGPPGAGKTMIAERMPSILPPLSENERLELSKIYSICGLLDNDSSLRDSRPFRNPHYSAEERELIRARYRLHTMAFCFWMSSLSLRAACWTCSGLHLRSTASGFQEPAET